MHNMHKMHDNCDYSKNSDHYTLFNGCLAYLFKRYSKDVLMCVGQVALVSDAAAEGQRGLM
jgi:hypothetical protein